MMKDTGLGIHEALSRSGGIALALALLLLTAVISRADSGVPNATGTQFAQSLAASAASGNDPSLLWYLAHGGPSRPLIPYVTGTEFPALGNLHMTGFVQNQSGVFVDSKSLPRGLFPCLVNGHVRPGGVACPVGRTILPFGAPTSLGESIFKSHNSLATERSWIQDDINWDPIPRTHLYVRLWGVYEPAYPIENADIKPSHDWSDQYNQYGIHDAWIRYQSPSGRFSIFFGRQIVAWGESITFRVNDVVNPQDTSYAFGFANLEQSRLPIWMIHPIINAPDLGPLTNVFLEPIFAPAFQPMYTNISYPDHQYHGWQNVAGNYNLRTATGERFDNIRYPITYGGELTQCGNAACTPPLRFIDPHLLELAPFPQVTQVGGPHRQIFRPAPFWKYGDDTWTRARYGTRVHFLLGENEISLIYWHAPTFTPVTYLRTLAPDALAHLVGPKHAAALIKANNTVYNPITGRSVLGPRGFNLKQIVNEFPTEQNAGASLNRAIFVPFWPDLPLALRAEGLWQGRTPFQCQDGILDLLHRVPNNNWSNGVCTSDTISTLVALDVTSMYAPWLTETGTLTARLEWNNRVILSPNKFMLEGSKDRVAYPAHNTTAWAFSIGTQWWWGAIAPNLVGAYGLRGQTALLFPDLALTPPWTSNYFFDIKYINVLSRDILGAEPSDFKGRQMIVFTTQWNFQLL